MKNYAQLCVGLGALLTAVAIAYLLVPEAILGGWIIPMMGIIFLAVFSIFYKYSGTLKTKKSGKINLEKASRKAYPVVPTTYHR